MCVCKKAVRTSAGQSEHKKTHNDEADEDGKAEKRKVDDKRGPVKERKEVLERVRRLGHDAKDADEHRAAGDEQRAEDNPEREAVTKQDAREERVPKERDGAKRREDYDGERSDLENRSEDVR
jgi:hypothetical protein